MKYLITILERELGDEAPHIIEALNGTDEGYIKAAARLNGTRFAMIKPLRTKHFKKVILQNVKE